MCPSRRAESHRSQGHFWEPGIDLPARYNFIHPAFPVIESSMVYINTTTERTGCSYKGGIRISSTRMATWYLVKVW